MITYLPTFMPNRILIIGGGGTGGRLVPLLAQFIKTCAWIPNPEITIIDDDVVEEKNLQRQNFIATDVGKPKAQVLAQRYSRAFNVPITPIVRRVTKLTSRYHNEGTPEFEQEAVMVDVFSKHSNNAIIVMCVDSPEARRHIVGRIYGHGYGSGNVLLLDSGNENDFGQVSVSTGKICNYIYEGHIIESWGNTVPGEFMIPLIPINLSYYENMVAADNLSCADLDQTMAINCMMANTMFGIIQNFYYAKPISFHRLNVSLSHGITPEYMNPKFLIANGTPDNHVMLGNKFSNENLYMPSVIIKEEVRAFHLKVAKPMKAALDKAKMDAEMAEAAKLEKIKEKAVADAMRLHGWKLPKPVVATDKAEQEEALAEALKNVAKTEKLKKYSELLTEKKAVKKAARKIEETIPNPWEEVLPERAYQWNDDLA